MKTTVKSLQDLYVKLGGSLTDTYDAIANDVPVSDYTTIPDMVEAVTQVSDSGGGGGGSDGDNIVIDVICAPTTQTNVPMTASNPSGFEYSQAVAAINAGKRLFMRLSYPTTDTPYAFFPLRLDEHIKGTAIYFVGDGTVAYDGRYYYCLHADNFQWNADGISLVSSAGTNITAMGIST